MLAHDTVSGTDEREDYAHVPDLQTHNNVTVKPLNDGSVIPHAEDDYIAHLLAKDDDILSVCSGLLEIVDRERFTEIGKGALRSFYLGLEKQAKTELERNCVRSLKSRSRRRRICESIAYIVSKEYQNKGANRNVKGRHQSEMKVPLEFIRIVPHTHTSYDSSPTRQQGGVYQNQDAEPEFKSEDNNLGDLFKTKRFLRGSEAFRILLNDLRIHLLPDSLRDIIQTVSYRSLSLSVQHENSLENRAKAFVEDFTMLEWNWWPLKPRMKTLSTKQMRLIWHCVSSPVELIL